MKIEIPKQELETALAVVRFGVGVATSLSSLVSHYVFRYREEDGLVEVLSHGGRIAALYPMRAEVTGEPSVFTVEAWRLDKWVAAVEDAALTLEFAEGAVVATSPKGSVKFQSEDPKDFPYWDETFKEAKPTVTINAKLLQGALSHAKLFLSDKDTTRPAFTVAEIRDGSMLATDSGAMSIITCDAFKKCKIRVNRKDAPKLISFLAACGDVDIEIREHKKCSFYIRPDAGHCSVTRSRHKFPPFDLDRKDYDPYWWDLKADDIRSGLNVLIASAAREDTHVNFKLIDGDVVLQMASASGDPVQVKLTPEDVGRTSPEDLDQMVEDGALTAEDGETAKSLLFPMPKKGFDLAHPYLTKMLGYYKEDKIRFGLNPVIDEDGENGGWVRCREDRNGVDYTTLLVWLV